MGQGSRIKLVIVMKIKNGQRPFKYLNQGENQGSLLHRIYKKYALGYKLDLVII